MAEDRKKDSTIGGLMRTGRNILQEAGIENASGEVRDIMMHLLGASPAKLFVMETETAPEKIEEIFSSIIEKRSTHYPIQYILGSTCFMGYDFLCRENVLIPRFDTENLVAAAVNAVKAENRPLRVLDMCTGSGCIGISFFLERQKLGVDDCVTLTDISQDALNLARENARKLTREPAIDEKSPGITIKRSNLFEELEGNVYDVFLTNPPYIPTDVCDTLMKDVKDYEPRLALDGEADGLAFYRRIIDDMGGYLNEGAHIFMEIGYDQYPAVRDMLEAHGYNDIDVIRDLNGLDRVVSCVK